MQSPLPLTRDLVLVGGGHAHALLLRRWGMRPLPGVRLTLVDPGPMTAYTGMLPGHVAGHYPRAALDIDLVRLARFAGARLVLAPAEGIDLEARRVRVGGRPALRYDLLSINIGIQSAMPELPGFADHGVAAKPLAQFADRWEDYLAEVAAGRARPLVAVIGGGVAGVELALAAAHRLRAMGHAGARVTVLEAGARIVPDLGEKIRARLHAAMAQLGVQVRTGVAVRALGPTGLSIEPGGDLSADFVIGAAGARPHAWLERTGLHLTGGSITVDAQLRSVSDPRVFAAGDCAHLSHAPRPKAGVYAVRAAPVLLHNIRAQLSGAQRRAFRPQRDFLKLVSLGGRSALAEKAGFSLSGRWMWSLKDRIDRRFMEKLTNLPAMPPALPKGPLAEGVLAELAGGAAPCAGCGAKLGGPGLRAALAHVPPPARADVQVAPGDDAAVLVTGGVRQVVSTDHLRAFTADPWMLGRIAAVHALGDIWAMGAAPQAALASVILPRMRAPMQEDALAEIMAAAAEVFRAAGADIAGGHTTVGPEMVVGFTVTGIADRTPILLSGAMPGDRLILTKPLGSGTILAAEMAGRAAGRDVAAAWRLMAQSQAAAAEILGCAHAMTDVTGFGLAGHLLAMLEASGVRARLDLGAVPLMPGAEALAGAGVRSTLYPDNRAALGLIPFPDTPRAALAFDPQTGGGMLAAVPPEAAPTCLARLVDAGYAAAGIGEILDGAPWIETA